ncbi:MAG: pyridoxamine 5'-phosphate oxidase [Alphaproteobacteria bacterium]
MIIAAVPDPFSLFATWLTEAETREANDHNAMALATASPGAVPSVRMVLLKGFDPRGFVFYTNYRSRKGQELSQNPQAALCFHWKSLRRQIRIEGTVAQVSPEEADTYFISRPYGSQIGAWASQQSQPLSDRRELEARVTQLEQQYPATVPRPDYWSGFRLTPRAIEFWQNMPSRLHDRLLYTRMDESSSWTIQRLQP